MMESADPGWDRVVHILGASAAREELTELSAECEDIRARIAEADAQLDAEMPEPPSAEHRLDTMLHTMASLLVSVCKLNNRRDELLAATSDEEREFVTEEICLIETEMERSDSGQDMSVSTEVTDMLGDYFDQSKRGST